MTTRVLFLLYLCSTFISYSQSFSSHPVALTPTSFPTSTFNTEQYKQRLNKKFTGEPKSSDLDSYIKQNALAMEDFFLSNQVYTNWPEATDYVKKVFTKAVPKEYNINEVKIYVVRDPDPNAFCMEDGNIAVTVGFLSFMSNEAELASTLCHEFGHYYSNHLYLDFKKQNKNKVIKVLTQATSGVGSLIIMKNLSSFQQNQERQADTFAYNFFTKNGYSPNAAIGTEINFQKITNKYKKLKGYRRPLLYFSTHPSDEERVQNAKDYFKNKNLNGKNFQVDSAGFFAFKKRAIDETIYLLFERLQYDECLELAYSQYLYYPKDEFYIFFITECLRRQAIFERGFSEELFVTGKYNDLTPVVKTEKEKPIIIRDNKPKKVNSKEYARSVYANLQNEIYNLTPEDVKKIKAPEILKQDTLSFLYNEDAMAYFNAKVTENSCIFNIHRILSEKPIIGNCENRPGVTELENDYTNVISDYKMLKNSLTEYKKAPVIFFDLNLYYQNNKSVTRYADAELENEVYAQYADISSAYVSDIIEVENKFNFRELQKLRGTTRFIESFFGIPLNIPGAMSLFGSSGGGPESDCDFLNVFPELSHEINKYKYGKLIFLELNLTNASAATEQGGRSVGGYLSANIYIVDLIKKRIKERHKHFSVYNFSDTRKEKMAKILDACQAEAKE